MNRYTRSGLALLILLLGTTAQASDGPNPDALDPVRLQQVFVEAGKAYDAGRPAEAAAMYEALLNQGVFSKELFYNLGNARFKSGDLGAAVLNYRRAWYLAPRDPDINANLGLVFQTAGVTAPDFPLREAAALRLSLPAWIRLAVIGYWGAAGLFCVYIVLQRWRLPLLRTATGLCILFAVSLAAAWVWLGFYYQPEVVVTAPNVKALFAPLENSTAHFALPAGALVRTEETSGNWIKIAYDKQSGWIPQTACQPVFDAAFLKHSSLP